MSVDEIGHTELPLEREKLAFEREKWNQTSDLERDKARSQARGTWISGGSILASALTLAATLAVNIYIQNRQSQDAINLKAAEVVLTTATVQEARNRADGLAALFPGGTGDRLFRAAGPACREAQG